MNDFGGANDRGSMCFQPFHSQNEVNIGGLQNNGRNKELQPFNLNGNIMTNHGSLTPARRGTYHYCSVHGIASNVVRVCKIF